MRAFRVVRPVVVGVVVALVAVGCNTTDDGSSTTDDTTADTTADTTGDTTADTTGDTTADTTGDTTADTTGGTTPSTDAPTVAPAGLASQVLAPDGVVYVSEAAIGSTGYWTNYLVDSGTSPMLDDYAGVLEVLGWTVGDVGETGFSATTDGGWLDVVVADDTLSVCVWAVAPGPDDCADFPASLSDTSPPPTDAS